MKKTLLLLTLMICMVSCYEDDATFTMRLSGDSEKYMISYADDLGVWNDSLVVERGFEFYTEQTDDWTLKCKIWAPDSIYIRIFKRGDYMQTIRGKDSLLVEQLIKHSR